MAINKFMMMALKVFSYTDYDVKKNYKLDRMVANITHPTIKLLYSIWDHHVFVDGYEIPVRVFQPKEVKNNDTLLFFHGGGWVSGNINNYTKICADMADCTCRRVISVDYRLAPEYPFPYGVEDCYRVAKEMFNSFIADSGDIILIGDSAGGNLAAVVSLMAKDRGEFAVKKQILLYPATYNDHSENSPYPSIAQNGQDYLLTSKKIRDYMDLYIQDKKDENNPYVAPLLADDLTNQPKTLIVTAEFDPLRDEGEAYGEKLKTFNNDVEIVRIPDALHGFMSLPLRFTLVKECYQIINTFLDKEIN